MTRDEFMDMVYSELHSDGDNYRANRIIDAADEYVKTEKESVLDKIRAEIEQEIIPRNSDKYDYETKWQNLGLRMALKIINKYKAESEK